MPTKFDEAAIEITYDLEPKIFGILAFLKSLNLQIIGQSKGRNVLKVVGLQKSLLFGQGHDRLNPSAAFSGFQSNDAYWLTDIAVVTLRRYHIKILNIHYFINY